jgi:hypothetical protein
MVKHDYFLNKQLRMPLTAPAPIKIEYFYKRLQFYKRSPSFFLIKAKKRGGAQRFL